MGRATQFARVLSLMAVVFLAGAATRGIGVVMSDGGSILIDGARAAGNATIFEGSVLETQSGISQVRMSGGAQIWFASQSRGKIFADRVEMLKGSAQISGFTANAGRLSIRATGDAAAGISVLPGGNVEVGSLAGDVHVFNAAGIVVASLLPGKAVNLTPEGTATGVQTIAGVHQPGCDPLVEAAHHPGGTGRRIGWTFPCKNDHPDGPQNPHLGGNGNGQISGSSASLVSR